MEIPDQKIGIDRDKILFLARGSSLRGFQSHADIHAVAMTSLRLALKQSLEESSGGFSPPSLGGEQNNSHQSSLNPNSNAPPSPPNRTGVSSPTAAAAAAAAATSTGSLAIPNTSSSALVTVNRNGLSPQPWKKRGPGRPRKTQPGDAGGTVKKRGRPRKHPVSEEQQDQEDPSSSENEFSGDEEIEEGEEDQLKDATEPRFFPKPFKKKKLVPPLTGGEAGKDAQCESAEISDLKSSLSSTSSDPVARKELKAFTNKEGNRTITTSRDRESDDGRPTRTKTVPPPHPRVLSWTRNLPVKEARLNVKQGIRVKVRFSTKPKKEGKRKKKWYGGLVSQVSKAGSKIRIKYDDGTSEVSRFPDEDVVVDATFNGEHRCPSDFFDPPDDDESTDEEQNTIEQHSNPQESAEAKPLTTAGQPHPEPDTNPIACDARTPINGPEEESGARKEGSAKQLSCSETKQNETTMALSEKADVSKDEDGSKPKRKRGRPPKVRPQPYETFGSIEEPPNKSGDKTELRQSTVSPVPTEDSADPLVDTPVQQPRIRDVLVSEADIEDGSIKFSSEPAAMRVADTDEEKPTSRLISIRIPKLKAASDASNMAAKPIANKPTRPIAYNEAKRDSESHPSSKRIHIHLSVPKYLAGKDVKEETDTLEDQALNTKERASPLPVAVTNDHPDDDLRTPSSPRSKKIKRKRPESSPGTGRARSPRPHMDEPVDKFASIGSAFEKSSLTGRLVNDSIDEDGKAFTPRGRPPKVDAARSARRIAAKEANERMSSKQEEPLPKKKQKRDRRRDVVGGDESDQEGNATQSPPWVQCDKCKKWRIIPSEVVGSLPERWFCENNTWDPKRASCDAPQQKDKQLVRERKRRKRQRLLEKTESVSDVQGDAVSDESNDHENSATSRSQDDVDGGGAKKPPRASPTDNSDSSVNNDQKVDKKSNPKKIRSQVEPPIEPPEDENAVDLKPRGRGRPRRNMVKESCANANNEQNTDEVDNLEWVQCERCDKWRKLPPEISADELPEVWYCSMNTWNPASACCSAPEDKAEAGLTDIFNNNGGTSSGKLSYRNLIFGNGRKFSRSISERTRAAESLFAAVSDDADAPPTVMYSNSSAFISRGKLNQPEETDGLSVLELMNRSHLWKELHAMTAGFNGSLCAFDRLSCETKESLKDLILHSLGSRTMSGEEVANDIQHRNWQNVPLGWAAAQPHCTVNTITMTMCELVKEGVLECMKSSLSYNGSNPDAFVLTYRRAKSYSQATLKHMRYDDPVGGSSRCMKFAKPWKCNEAGEE